MHRSCGMLLPFLITVSIAISDAACLPAQITIDSQAVTGSFGTMLLCSGDEIVQVMTAPGTDSLVAETGVEMLRMGGIAAEYYDWEGADYNGLHYIDIGGIMAVDTLDNSLDNLLQFCGSADIEPILTVNHHINDPGKAARMVEYCNGDADTPMGAVRAARGHPEPYDVTWWAVGNEPDIAGGTFSVPPWGTWTFYRHFSIPFDEWSLSDSVFCTPGEFADLVGEYCDSMRARSPIPLNIGGLSLAGELSWIEPVIGQNNTGIDWMDVHYYPVSSWTSDSVQYSEWLAAPTSGTSSRPPLEEWYPAVSDTVEKYAGGFDIPVYLFEYNVMAFVEDPVWWNYLDGLFIADCLGHMGNASVSGAAQYSILEGAPGDETLPLFGAIRGDTLSMRSAAWVLKLFRQRFGQTVVHAQCNQVSGGYGLEVYASRLDDWTLSLMAVNKNLDSAYTATIELQGYTSDGSAEVWQIASDAPMQAPWNGTTGIEYLGEITGSASLFQHTFPRASVTCIWFHPDAGDAGSAGAAAALRLGIAPNPCRKGALITGTLPPGENGELRLYDLAGRLVRVYSVSSGGSDEFSVWWDGSSGDGTAAVPGLYMFELVSFSGTTAARLVSLP